MNRASATVTASWAIGLGVASDADLRDGLDLNVEDPRARTGVTRKCQVPGAIAVQSLSRPSSLMSMLPDTLLPGPAKLNWVIPHPVPERLIHPSSTPVDRRDHGHLVGRLQGLVVRVADDEFTGVDHNRFFDDGAGGDAECQCRRERESGEPVKGHRHMIHGGGPGTFALPAVLFSSAVTTQ